MSGAVWIWLEQRADFLKVGASWFSLAPRALHHEYKSPTTCNITAYLARIHMLNIVSLKDHSNQEECEGYDDIGSDPFLLHFSSNLRLFKSIIYSSDTGFTKKSIHPSSSAYPGPGRGGSSLSRDAQTSLFLVTSSSSSGGTPRRSQASRET